MANEGEPLTESQERDVVHLQDMLNCSTEEAVTVLRRCDWNLETAAQSVFDNPQPSDSSPPPEDTGVPRLRRPEQATTDSSAVVNRQNLTGIWAVLNPIAELALLPFRYALSILGTIVRLLSSFWTRPAINHQSRVVDATGDVKAFIQDMQQAYNSNQVELPRFFQGAYSAALREAQRELMFLLVFIHAEENPASDSFCRHVLTDDRFKTFVSQNNIILWGCNVERPEGQRVAHTIRATQFPVLALISLKHSAMTIVLRISGSRMAEAVDNVIASLTRAIAMEGAHLIQERERRRHHAAQQELRHEQDRLYAETVRQDTERQRAQAKREADEAAKAREAEEKMKKRGNLRQKVFDEIKAAAINLAPEPGTDSNDAVQIVVRLPSGGSQLRRRFLVTDPLSAVYEWVHGGYWESAENIHALQLVVSYPKRELPLPRLFADLFSDPSVATFESTIDGELCTSSSTLEQVGITRPQALLAVVVDYEEDSLSDKQD